MVLSLSVYTKANYTCQFHLLLRTELGDAVLSPAETQFGKVPHYNYNEFEENPLVTDYIHTKIFKPLQLNTITDTITSSMNVHKVVLYILKQWLQPYRPTSASYNFPRIVLDWRTKWKQPHIFQLIIIIIKFTIKQKQVSHSD